ncbi:LIM domain only protein 7-like isoform X3 [Coregonus clupeaformis]|uniref:LIM domain only protein 7-like isoform X3 n=1 Tax=Coregonus clupeaformis TaxID=59861 RepID=UPI001E1C3B64|nr:LIM domain only protein 7-like isoform X3 [Coregonus clupeaformis]
MEWRQRTSVSCEDAFTEAQRWMEEVTSKSFGCNNFRSALENGVLLCHLINRLKPGIIKRMNTLSTPMAGLDNVNVFLRACGTLGLHEAQLFHPGDLQDLSTRATLRRVEGKRRLKNVLITIYWLGRKAQVDPFYSGPQLNLKAFEGLLGIALSKALEEAPRGSVRASGSSEVCYPEREDQLLPLTHSQPPGYSREDQLLPLTHSQPPGYSREDQLLPLTHSQPPGYSREDSVESFKSVLSFDSVESRTLSFMSDSILRAGSEDSSSDAEAENCFRMESAEGRDSGQSNGGIVPASLQRKKQEEYPIKGYPPSLLTRSKSLNDIRRFPSATVVLRQVSEGGVELSPSAVSQDQLQRVRARVQESEVKWHNDLTKWKLRRCRSNFDLRRKIQERDNNVLMANAGVVTVGTFRSLQEDREEDEEAPYSSSHATVSPSTSAKDGSLDLRPHTRAPPALSSSVESPYSPGASEPSTTPSVTLQARGPSARAAPRSEPLVLGERRHTGTPVDPDAAGGLAPTLSSASPLSSQTRGRAISSPALMISTGLDQNTSMLSNGIPTTLTNGIGSGFTTGTSSSPTASGLVNGTGSNLTDGTSSNRRSASKALLSALETQTSVVEPDSGRVSAPQQQDLPLFRYSSRVPGGAGVSASLPRGYRRSESSSSLSAGFTPRPFGSKPSRVSSIPRLYNYLQLENPTLNGDRNASLLPTKTAPSRPQKMVTISEVAVGAQPRAPANRSGVNQEVKEEGASQTQPSILNARVGPGPATRPKPSREGPLPPPLLPSLAVSVTQNGSAQVRHSDRVSLTLKLNGRPDFGFNTHWDSAGVRVGGIQPGSPAELGQLRAGDEIVSVGGHRVAEMSHDQWKGTMTSALQKGSLTMDVQRYGNNDWGSGLPSHKIINLTSGAPTLIGRPDASRDAVISTATRVKPAQLNGQEVNCVTSKSMKGGVRDDPVTIRRKEHELIVLKTQERRAEFFKQKGGSASAISDLQVPSLSTSPSSWSWDPEEERSRQEKWQQEQERLLQERYRQDQERLDAEWQRAQEEAGVAGYSQAEVTPEPSPSRDVVGNVVPRVKSPASNAESSGEMTNGIAGPASPQPVLSQPTPPVAHVASNQKKEVVFNGVGREEPDVKEAEQEEETDGLAEGDDWSGDTYGFTQLSTADRMKSKSSSSLDGFHRQEMKGGTREVPRRKQRQSMSLVEADRQQILEEMKRRTALLTDNSWIRQRSTSINKQPVNRRGPMRRYESLDNLPSTTSSPSLPSNPQRPHSSLGFTAPYRPPSSRHSMGGALGGYSNGTQKHSPTWPRPFSTSSTPPNPGEEPATGESRPGSQQRDRVWTASAILEGQKSEPRSESETGSLTVNPATSDSSPDLPAPCDQNALQQIEEETTTTALQHGGQLDCDLTLTSR